VNHRFIPASSTCRTPQLILYLPTAQSRPRSNQFIPEILFVRHVSMFLVGGRSPRRVRIDAGHLGPLRQQRKDDHHGYSEPAKTALVITGGFARA